MIYEIANPSDPVTLESDDPKLVAITILVTSQGKYGVTDEKGGTVLPVFLMAKAEDIDHWLKETFGMPFSDIDAYMTENALRMAELLETAMVCQPGQRKALMVSIEAGGGDVKKALAAWNEEQRSSLNDICGRCFSLAKAFRQTHAERSRAGMHVVENDAEPD